MLGGLVHKVSLVEEPIRVRCEVCYQTNVYYWVCEMGVRARTRLMKFAGAVPEIPAASVEKAAAGPGGHLGRRPLCGRSIRPCWALQSRVSIVRAQAGVPTLQRGHNLLCRYANLNEG